MSHKGSKQDWFNLTPKEQENLFKEVKGTRLIPKNLSGTEIDNLVKTGQKQGWFSKLFSSNETKTKK